MKRRKFLGLGTLVVGGFNGLKSLLGRTPKDFIAVFVDGEEKHQVCITVDGRFWCKNPEKVRNIFAQWFYELKSFEWPRTWGEPPLRFHFILEAKNEDRLWNPWLGDRTEEKGYRRLLNFMDYLGGGEEKTWPMRNAITGKTEMLTIDDLAAGITRPRRERSGSGVTKLRASL